MTVKVSILAAAALAAGATAVAAAQETPKPVLAQAPRIAKPEQLPPGTIVQMPTLPPAEFDKQLQIGGDDVKARKKETRLSVDVLVNGRGPYKFVVDSGADTSVVGLRIAQSLQLPVTTPAVLNGMTSRAVVDRVKVDSLRMGPSIIRDLQLPALREYDVGGDGLIGIDALTHQRLFMDFDSKIIKVEDAARPYRYDPTDIVITAKRQRGQLILTQVRADRTPLDAVVDTGSEISIGNTALRDRLIRKGRGHFTTIPVTGVTGVTVNLQLARIDELQIGPITLQDVPIAFADVPPFQTFGLAKEPALLLGTDLLETFRRISLDFKARKIRFQLRRCSTSTIAISTDPANATRISASAEQGGC